MSELEPEPLFPPFWAGVVTAVEPPGVESLVDGLPGLFMSSLVQATEHSMTEDRISAERPSAAALLVCWNDFIV